MFKAIVFDADNTLYKVRPERAYDVMFSIVEAETGAKAETLKRAWKQILEDILKSPNGRDLGARNRERSMQILLEKFGVTDKVRIAKITDIALSAFWKQALLDLQFDESEKQTISNLKSKYVLAVASDEFRKSLEMKLNRVFGDWRQYFKFIISAEDAGEHKPSERYCRRTLEMLKMEPSEILLVGDSWERDIEPAKKLGIRTVLIAAEKEGKPDYFIRSLPELLRIDFKDG